MQGPASNLDAPNGASKVEPKASTRRLQVQTQGERGLGGRRQAAPECHSTPYNYVSQSGMVIFWRTGLHQKTEIANVLRTGVRASGNDVPLRCTPCQRLATALGKAIYRNLGPGPRLGTPLPRLVNHPCPRGRDWSPHAPATGPPTRPRLGTPPGRAYITPAVAS